MTSNSKIKGDALEAALEIIESSILLEDPGFAHKELKIIPKRIVSDAGVRHEIDLWVEVAAENGYDSLFIFECKNWKRKLGKNEVIIFSEKIKVTNATRGFIVAHKFTKDAVNQAKVSGRIKLLTARELLTNELPTLVATLHGIWVRGIQFAASFEKAVPSKTNLQELQGREIEVDGSVWAADQYMNQWQFEALKRSLTGYASAYMDTGSHDHSFSETRYFEDERFLLNGEPIRSVTVSGTCQLMIERGAIISCIEVSNRGRAFQWRCKFPDEEYYVDIGRVHGASGFDDSSGDQSGYMRIVALPVFTAVPLRSSERRIPLSSADRG